MSILNSYLSKSLLVLKEAQSRDYITSDTKVDDVQAVIEKCVKNISQTDRRIRVAIAGKMNTGKSMLIDNLFFKGAGVVTSDEIPSTARLSTLSYSEHKYAVVTFITAEDIERLKRLSERYKKESDESEKSAYEIYNAIESSNIQYQDFLGDKREIPFNNLKEYSDAQGKYTAFVKTIDIYTDQPVLKDIEIIDTPGLGDPIVSREEITNKKMNDVDLVIFLSHASMFMDDNDINYYLFLRRKGIQNVIVLASRFDETLNSKEYAENDPCNSRTFVSIYDDFIERFKDYTDSSKYVPTDIYPSMPLLAKIYHILQRSESLSEVLAFYRKKLEKKLQLNFTADPILKISGIEPIEHKLEVIAAGKENQIFISNKNAVLACFHLILGIYENKLREFRNDQAKTEIELDDPKLLEKIKNEIKYFAIECNNVITDAKSHVVHSLIKPKCQTFKVNYKGYIESLKDLIDGHFDWLHKNENEPGSVSRNIRNSCNIFSTNITELFDLSLGDIFGIGENGNLYHNMLDDLKKRLDSVKINIPDTNKKEAESVNRLIKLLKESIYSRYMDQLVSKIGPNIVRILDKESVTNNLGEYSRAVSGLADGIYKEAGWREGVREERRNINSRIKLAINSEIDKMQTDVVTTIDRLGSTGLIECFEDIRVDLMSVVSGYENDLFGNYADLGTKALSDKLIKVNRSIIQIEELIRSIKNAYKEIEELTTDL